MEQKIGMSILCIILILQSYYMMQRYPKLKQCIADQNESIATGESKLQELNEGLGKIQQLQLQLEVMQTKEAALQSSIPEEDTMVLQMYTLNQYMKLNGLYQFKITDEGREVYKGDVGNIIKQYYILDFISSYDEAKTFIRNLNNAREMITIQNVMLTNQVQEINDKDEMKVLQEHFGKDLSEVVQTQLRLVMYTQEGKTEKDRSETQGVIHNEAPFTNVYNKDMNEKSDRVDESIEVSQEIFDEESGRDIFEITLVDLFTSGETYKLSGPGEKHAGLISKENIYMTLKIDQVGYSIKIEDEKGNVKQDSCTIQVKKPILYLESTMRQIQEVMPQIYIYIYNDLEEDLEVKLNGSLLENVHIYNEFEEELSKGESKGSIKIS